MTTIKKSTEKTKNQFSPNKKPLEISFEEWQVGLRKQFSQKQKFIIKNIGDEKVFSDYDVINKQTQKSYKVALRSKEAGLNFCACPDFRINNLGTCKHIESVFNLINSKNQLHKLLDKEIARDYSSVTLSYTGRKKIILRIGSKNANKIKKLATDFFDSALELKQDAFSKFDVFYERVKNIDPKFVCYDDALEFIITEREKIRRKNIINEHFPQGPKSKILNHLVNLPLYEYQKKAVYKAVEAGRYLIADDMGLGKTIQSIATSIAMRKIFGVEKVLIICPTSLKYQWQSEIKKITGKDSLVVEGSLLNREEQYQQNDFYKIVSYNSISRDATFINKLSPDLIILDEAQRIKNWKTKTSQSVKKLSAPFCLVLTGTPLENKLDELHSIVEFIDQFKLGLLSKFLYDHQVKDDSGKVVGYKDLNKIGDSISSISIRRTKSEVLKQLPGRIDKNIFVEMTTRQLDIHEENKEYVGKLIKKWKNFGFLNEKDRNFLMISLNRMRMACDSTYILDQKSRHDTKIAELRILLEDIFQNKDEKVVIFSQWERMTRIISQELDDMKIGYEYLHGGIPSKERKGLLDNFRDNPASRVFLSTDAGGVGLNLQSASVVINMDCPWNPAVLEQRISRIHRLGQLKPVTVINYISKGTIEERMLELLSFKKKMFEGVLDGGADTIFMGESKMKQFMKTVEQLNEITEKPLISNEVINETNDFILNEEADSISEYNQPTDSNIFKPEQSVIHSSHNNQQINELVQTGISFFNKLGEILNDKQTVEKTVSRLIHRDEKTNQKYIKIPEGSYELIEKAGELLKKLFH